jgi:hypothetical protein
VIDELDRRAFACMVDDALVAEQDGMRAHLMETLRDHLPWVYEDPFRAYELFMRVSYGDTLNRREEARREIERLRPRLRELEEKMGTKVGTTKVGKPDTPEFETAPEGLHPGVCCDVWTIWTEERPERWGGGLVDKTRIVWQIDQTYKGDDGKERRYEVSMPYTASLHEKAKLRHHLESWRGRKFTKEELDEFDLEKLIGVNCQIQVVHNVATNGNTYANVQAIVPPAKGAPRLEVSPGYIRRRDRKKKNEESVDPDDYTASDDDVPF